MLRIIAVIVAIGLVGCTSPTAPAAEEAPGVSEVAEFDFSQPGTDPYRPQIPRCWFLTGC
jgi:hypothetical protein